MALATGIKSVHLIQAFCFFFFTWDIQVFLRPIDMKYRFISHGILFSHFLFGNISIPTSDVGITVLFVLGPNLVLSQVFVLREGDFNTADT